MKKFAGKINSLSVRRPKPYPAYLWSWCFGEINFARKLQLALGEERVNLLETDPYVIAGEYRDLLSSKDFPH